jgi:hypothetical protein
LFLQWRALPVNDQQVPDHRASQARPQELSALLHVVSRSFARGAPFQFRLSGRSQNHVRPSPAGPPRESSTAIQNLPSRDASSTTLCHTLRRQFQSTVRHQFQSTLLRQFQSTLERQFKSTLQRECKARCRVSSKHVAASVRRWWRSWRLRSRESLTLGMIQR